jgi:ASPIC/UnbV protein
VFLGQADHTYRLLSGTGLEDATAPITRISQPYHFGIGGHSAVDVRVTFPDGRKVTRTGVAPSSRMEIRP